MSFVFFDTETTGLEPGFDQIVHFAAIRTDHELKEIERFECRSKLLSYVVPHPKAMRINRISIGRLTDPALPSHYEMVCEIHRQLRQWSPAIFVGFNSIRFDEEMLRQALFQSLFQPYLTSYHNNARTDAMSLFMTACSLSPNLIVPFLSEGRPTFRLAELARANGIEHDRAHNAMADAAATLGLCRLVRDQSSEVWNRFIRFSKKAAVSQFVESEDGFILTEFFRNEAFHTPVVLIGTDPRYPNGRLCLGLAKDPGEIETMGDDELREMLAQKPCPVRRLRINAAPALTELFDAPEPLRSGLDINEIEDRARRVKNSPTLQQRLVAICEAGRTPKVLSPHVEQQMNEGFPSEDDERRRYDFQDGTWRDRANLIKRFEDKRLRALARRLIYTEQPATLPPAVQLEMDKRMRDRLLIDSGGPLTLEKALREADALLAEGGEPDTLIVDYRAHLVDWIARVSQVA